MVSAAKDHQHFTDLDASFCTILMRDVSVQLQLSVIGLGGLGAPSSLIFMTQMGSLLLDDQFRPLDTRTTLQCDTMKCSEGDGEGVRSIRNNQEPKNELILNS
jgi:hypothetical protein